MHFPTLLISALSLLSSHALSSPIGFPGAPNAVRKEANVIAAREMDNWAWADTPLERSPSDPEMDADAAELARRLVYNPPITYPTKGTVWKAGENRKVTWETDEIPEELKNSKSKLMLGYELRNGAGGENLKVTLADGFPLTDGKVTFTLPSDLPTRNSYIVVLFGDSGNASPHFTINAANGGGNGRSNSDDTQSRTILENEISDFMLGRDI